MERSSHKLTSFKHVCQSPQFNWKLTRDVQLAGHEILLFTVTSIAYLPLNTNLDFAAGSDLAYRPLLFLESVFHMAFLELG